MKKLNDSPGLRFNRLSRPTGGSCLSCVLVVRACRLPGRASFGMTPSSCRSCVWDKRAGSLGPSGVTWFHVVRIEISRCKSFTTRRDGMFWDEDVARYEIIIKKKSPAAC